MILISLLALALSIYPSEGYVLLQVRKGDNQSNVDAVIHKVVPNLAEDSRKRSANLRYEISKGPKAEVNGLESLVLAINTGASPNQLDTEKSGVLAKVQELLVDLLKDKRVNSFFRSQDSYKVKPEIVHFRSGKPSLMLEVNFESVMNALKDALRSKKIRTYTDSLAQKAAVVYRTVVDEMRGGAEL